MNLSFGQAEDNHFVHGFTGAAANGKNFPALFATGDHVKLANVFVASYDTRLAQRACDYRRSCREADSRTEKHDAFSASRLYRLAVATNSSRHRAEQKYCVEPFTVC